MIVIRLYRIGNLLHRKSWFRLAKLVSYLNRFLFAVWLPSSAKIGRNFKLGYGGLGVVIHKDAIIGDNVLIAQNVTIGRNFGDKKVPVIGNDVYVGTGSVIFGEITIGNNVIIYAGATILGGSTYIGDNCVIGGNVWLTHSVESGRTVYNQK